MVTTDHFWWVSTLGCKAKHWHLPKKSQRPSWACSSMLLNKQVAIEFHSFEQPGSPVFQPAFGFREATDDAGCLPRRSLVQKELPVAAGGTEMFERSHLEI